MEGKIFIFDEIGDKGITPEWFNKELDKNRDASELTLYFDSPGGEVYKGYAIANLIKGCGKPTTAKIVGQCKSISTAIALACDKIVMASSSAWMVHNPYAKVEGDADTLRKSAGELEQMQNALRDGYAKKMGKSKEEVEAIMKEGKTYTAKEAETLGFVDEVAIELKAVAYVKQEFMSKETESLIAKALAKIDKFLSKAQPKNMAVELEDGAKLWIETEDGEFAGKKAWMADAEGNPSDQPAPDGTHKLIDGRSITIAGGMVESVQEAANLEKELADAKAELAKAAEEKNALGKQVQEMTEALNETKATVLALQKSVAGDTKPAGASATAMAAKAKAEAEKNKNNAPKAGSNGWLADVAKQRAGII